MFPPFWPSLVGRSRISYVTDRNTRMCMKRILVWFKITKLLTILRYKSSQVLRWLLIGCWSSHVTDVLVCFQPLRHPYDPDYHREEGGSMFLRNIGKHIYHAAYEPKRRPTERSSWKLALQ